MATATTVDEVQTLEDLLDRLGGIAPGRVRVRPPVGTATEADLIAANERKQGICELVDGVLVEKGMGLLESLLAGALIAYLRGFVIPRNLGIVTSPDGMLRLVRASSAPRTSPSSPGVGSREASSRPKPSAASPPTWPSRS